MSSEQVERGQRVECPFCNASAVRPPTPDNEAGLFWSLPPNSPMVDEAELLQQFLSQDDWHELEEPTLEALFQRMSSQLEASQQALENRTSENERLRELATELVNIEDMGDLKYIVEDFVAALEEQEAQDEQ